MKLLSIKLKKNNNSKYNIFNDIMIHFDTDYMRGAHPEIMKRMLETNLEQTTGYGTDSYTEKAKELIRTACNKPEAGVHFLVGGTQTNATVIDALLKRFEGVLAAETAHINVHEAGAIEASGHKVLTLPQYEGKVKKEDVEKYISDFYRDETYEHMVAPGMLYISHPTEYGTLYTKEELKGLSDVCKKANIQLYMDGARLGYGLAAENTDVTLQDIADLCDVFYIGGTKVGALFGEAVVAKNPETLPHFFPIVKQHGALLAKGRLLGIQFMTLFTDDLYIKSGAHAVRMAMKLKKAFIEKGYKMHIDSPTNQQFVCLPNDEIDRLSEYASFELWGPRGETETVVRFVTDWGTVEEDVDKFIELL